MKDLEFEELVDKLSFACDNHGLDTVIASGMCIVEQSIMEIIRVTENFTKHIDTAETLAYGLTAQRLEYLAKLLRGEQPEDPHENLINTIDRIQEPENENTH